MPVSEKYAAPLNTAIAKLLQEGNWRNMSDYHRPESRCEDEVVDIDTHPLGPKHLLGAYVLSAALVVFGVFISAVLEWGKNRKRDAANDILPSATEKQTERDLSQNSSSQRRMDDVCGAIANLTEEMARLKEAVACNQQQQREQSTSGDGMARSVVIGSGDF